MKKKNKTRNVLYGLIVLALSPVLILGLLPITEIKASFEAFSISDNIGLFVIACCIAVFALTFILGGFDRFLLKNLEEPKQPENNQHD